MKINEPGRIRSVNPYAQQMGAREAKATGKNKVEKDELQISAEAKELLEATKTENSDRSQRLQEIRQSVEHGTYQVDVKALAEKLLPFFKS